MGPDEDIPFFHRRETHTLIATLADQESIAIYLGSGATIDRTGLTWSGLVDHLLLPTEPDPELRRKLISRFGEVRVASIAADALRRRTDNPEVVSERIRTALYGSRQFLHGRLLEFVARCALSIAREGKSVVLVTPNYDDYLFQELVKQDSRHMAEHNDDPTVTLSAACPATADEEPQIELKPNDRRVHCLFIHGILPSHGGPASEKLRELAKAQDPVVTESDYLKSYASSREAIKQAFRGRTVIMIGTSVTDAPLVDALISLKDEPGESRPRYALLPLQSPEFADDSGALDLPVVDWNTRRLLGLDVTAVYPDYFSQAGQLIREVHLCRNTEMQAHMDDLYAPWRYGQRLLAWWNAWFRENCGSPTKQDQMHHHLADELLKVRRAIGSLAIEHLRLEVWLRWSPSETRELAMWASSVGSLSDIHTMKKVEIGRASEHYAVRAFRRGSPDFSEMPEHIHTRWRTHLSTPIWLEDQTGTLPVGVVALGSMERRERSFLSEENLDRLDTVLSRMNAIGRQTVTISGSAE